MTKKELRAIYKERRLTLTAGGKDKLEDLILIQFQKLDLAIPDVSLSYAPFEKYKEFDPSLIEAYCFFKKPEQILCYPVTNDITDDLNAVVVTDDTLFAANKYGIDEPLDADDVDAFKIDMVLLPLLAFDLKGHRVGYGKGFYDRFLKSCRPDVLKIGFSFFEAELEIDDVNDQDVRMDYCITPEKIYTF